MFKRSLKNYSFKKDFFNALNKRGVVLFIVLGTLLVVTSLATVILSLILSHARLTYHQTSRVQAYYAALAGMNLARENLRTGTWATGSYTLCKSGCTVNDSDIPYSVAINIAAPGTSIDGVGRRITITTTYTYTP
jgi:Tfp pilus assembly protein PilX